MFYIRIVSNFFCRLFTPRDLLEYMLVVVTLGYQFPYRDLLALRDQINDYFLLF